MCSKDREESYKDLIMSYSQLIKAIREHTDEEGRELLAEFMTTTGFIQPDFAAGALQLALEDGDLFIAPQLVDQLEKSLKKNYVPIPPEVNTHKKDMLRWFEYMRYFIEEGRLDGTTEMMWFYSHIFNPKGKTRCGAIRSRCSKAGVRRPEVHDGTCMFKFQSPEKICPTCDTPRTFCRRRPLSNGRCGRSGRSPGHGGDTRIGAMSATYIDGRNQLAGRQNIFAKQLEKRPNLQRLYLEAMGDLDYLSLEPEIALNAVRRAELLAALDDLDPVALEAGVKAAVNNMHKAMGKEKYDSVIFYAEEIEKLLEGGRDNRDRWREMNSLAGQMTRLAETERKRLVEARKSVSAEEMLLLRNETVKAIRTAVIDGADGIHHDYIRNAEAGTLGKMSPDYVKQAMLRHIANRLRPLEEAERAEIIEMEQEQEEEE